ncbi:hypothetical protein OG898_21550 [Streptomyces sp. NBC_00193]|uniref:hypothetical protein n=1 Tax=Streptomyces sp. NBC_00193 TaxID=2975675 RepID=UPI002255E4CE|nr:hypothetical protein [Streptomyces sp. NBC_00193]MCX5299043.1 hypothetical protein [Streptomyces sp. NBC_00193]
MNLRRTLATLAATTVVAPAVLLTATPAAASAAAATAAAPTAVTAPTDPFASCTSWTQADRVTTELLGFPTRLVAGTWSTFTFRTVNVSTGPLKAVGTNVDVSAWGAGVPSARLGLTVQWYDRAAKKWRPMPTRVSDFATVSGVLKPGARSDVRMRVMADRRSKAGDGFAFEFARYAGPDGVCGHAGTIHEYDFVVEPAAPAPKPTPTPTPTPTPKPATR